MRCTVESILERRRRKEVGYYEGVMISDWLTEDQRSESMTRFSCH